MPTQLKTSNTEGPNGPLLRRVAELLAAIEQGKRSRTRANLDLLVAHERLERLGRPVNAVASVAPVPGRRGDHLSLLRVAAAAERLLGS